MKIVIAIGLLFGLSSSGASPFRIATSRVEGPPPVVTCRDQSQDLTRPADDDGRAVTVLLEKLKSDEATAIYSKAPDTFLWWMRLSGGINLTSFSVAAHETQHFLVKKSRQCGGDGNAFYLRDRVAHPTIKRQQTPNYHIIAATWPLEWLSQRSNDRFNRYILASKNVSSNDFYTLLDEFAAYATAAEIEIQLLQKFPRQELAPEIPANAALDGQLNGAIEFAAYVAYYLVAIDQSDRGLRQAIVGDKGFQLVSCEALEKTRRAYQAYVLLGSESKSLLTVDSRIYEDLQRGKANDTWRWMKC